MTGRRRVAIITGSRAEYGLLRPVMLAVRDRPDLELLVIAAGSHLVSPAETYRDVKADFAGEIAAAIPMQVAGRTGRFEDAEATGIGVSRFARVFARLAPPLHWVVVLGDRIEAFAAASAASIGGIAVAHIHGGDRAEGIADEAMRHAITKLAQLHLAATPQSADRIVRMGELPDAVFAVGSPALDGLDAIDPMPAARFSELGAPQALVLMHPVGRSSTNEQRAVAAALEALGERRVLALQPNFDAGREGVVRALDGAGSQVGVLSHLPRADFIALLRRLADEGGVLVGNSSAALIEAAALRLPAVDIGPRQNGRERGTNSVHAADEATPAIRAAIDTALSLDRASITHPFGDGRAGPRIARLFAETDPAPLMRKRNAY